MFNLKRFFLILTVVGAVMMLIGFIVPSTKRTDLLVDTGETRAVVENNLAGLESLRPVSLDAPEVQKEMEQLLKSRFVATVWLFSPQGNLEYSAGSTAFREPTTAEQRATDETKRILAMLPEGALNEQQRQWLLMASAIQSEGEHNDVYRHLLRPLRSADGATLGMIGVAYDVSESVGSPGLVWMATVILFFLGLIFYWFSMPVWVWLDAKERGERALLWALFVFMGNLVALIAYLLVRVPLLTPKSYN